MNPYIMTTREYLTALKSLHGISAGIGLLVPGVSFFTKMDPPLLSGAGLVTAGLGAASIVSAYHYAPRERTSSSAFPLFTRIARRMFFLSLLSLLMYLLLLRWCTVTDPRGENRFQTGFGIADWSLTADGLKLKQEYPGVTRIDLMLLKGAFRDGGPELIWSSWSIYTSGILMTVAYLSTFMLWVFAWSLLAKQRAISDKQIP